MSSNQTRYFINFQHSTDNCINKNLNRIKSTKTLTYFMNSNNDMTWTKNIIFIQIYLIDTEKKPSRKNSILIIHPLMDVIFFFFFANFFFSCVFLFFFIFA